MALVKLKSAGALESSVGTATPGDRAAMLVYAGKFLSLDGEVEVTPKHIKLMIANHNKRLDAAAAKLPEGAELPLKHYPPIQLDHSTSARDTVGRLMGRLSLGEHVLDDGTIAPAVMSNGIRILGADNQERVADGRWTHLSLGVDLDKGKITELTITPFSAAPDASLLSAGTKEDNAMNRDKLKKHLMNRRKMSEKDADAHLSKMEEGGDDAMKKFAKECDDEETKMSAEEKTQADKLAAEENEKKAKGEKEAKLTAARTKLTQLSSGFKATIDGARLAARKGTILTRLSHLRGQAKITPAEIKKMDITKLAAADEASIDLVLKTYADREPVLHLGQFGSVKAADIANLGKARKQAGMSRLEAETRANMPLLAKRDKAKRLAAGDMEDLGNGLPDNNVEQPGIDPADLAYFKKEADDICQLMDQGSLDAAKQKLQDWMAKLAAMGASGSAEYTESNTVDTEAQLSALKESVTKLNAQFEELHGFAGSLIEA